MVNCNGSIFKNSETLLSSSNRGFLFGDAVFETMRIAAGKILFWEDHYLRLMASMRIMRMEIPMSFTMEYLESEILKTLAANDLNSKASRARLTVYRDEGGFYKPINNSVSYVISVSELETAFYLKNTNFYEVELFKDHYINSGILSTIKTTNKQVNILGGIFAKENDFQNCLLLNEHKRVVEAMNGNLFLVFGNTIKTPPI
ncbi:aminotransferase class IV, partial [uncultured Planktosalinus sp.]|uniref:aminotransferase class IV n=1 Tax=uncultured Planktosalinus sp. TaxID=1810935 RepID=UPI0030D83965